MLRIILVLGEFLEDKMNPIVIYPAAALFSGRESFFNIQLVDKLERKFGYVAKLPQRDGFEFGNLTASMSDKLTADEVSSAIQDIIYFLDMGIFIPKSDVVVANLDEPIDEGVAVEISYARMMGKCVIGYRTDIRSPFGNISEPFKGMHFFPAYQCNFFIYHYIPGKSISEAKTQIYQLADKIAKTIVRAEVRSQTPIPKFALSNPSIANILNGADTLFNGIVDIHSKQGLKVITQRYCRHRDQLKKLTPTIL